MISLVIGFGLGLFLASAREMLTSFLVKMVCAIIFDGALGSIVLGIAIGAVVVFLVNWLVTAVPLRRNTDTLDERPSVWGAL